MAYSFKPSSWSERVWRSNNSADMARGNVPGSFPYSTHGESLVDGGIERLIRESEMPPTLTVPDGIQLAVVSSSALDTGEIVIKYLDGDLLASSERLTLNGTTPVTTTATDIRAINNVYSASGPVNGAIDLTQGGVRHGYIPAGSVQYNTSIQRVPANKRLMVKAMYAGSASGSSAAKVIIKVESSFINGDSFANDGWLHPLGSVAAQDNSISLSGFGPFPIPGGEWIGFTAISDKAATVTAGLFGWLEDA